MKDTITSRAGLVKNHDPKNHGDVLNKWIDYLEHRAQVVLLKVPISRREEAGLNIRHDQLAVHDFQRDSLLWNGDDVDEPLTSSALPPMQTAGLPMRAKARAVIADFGRNVRTRRVAAGLRQKDLAAICQIGAQFICEIERANRTLRLRRWRSLRRA